MSLDRRQSESGHGVRVVATECAHCGRSFGAKESYATHISECPELGTAYREESP